MMLPPGEVLAPVLVALLDALPAGTEIRANSFKYVRQENGKWKCRYEWTSRQMVYEFPWDYIALPTNPSLFHKGPPRRCRECRYAVRPGDY